MDIAEALQALDPHDDAQWTRDGLPSLDAMASRVGAKLSRAEITAAAPDFTRGTARAFAELDGSASEPQADFTSDQDARSAYGRTWLYHPDCPAGRIFEGAACAKALGDGWVESPAALTTPAEGSIPIG